NDRILGGTNNDVLLGGSGNDSLYGDTNNNTMTGGAGADVIVSTAGARDTLIYAAPEDAGDTVQGFRRGEDVLDLRVLMDSIGYGGTNPVADGRLILATAPGGDLRVLIDADGAGGADTIQLLLLDNINATTLTLNTDYWV
ncbi:MAG: hypothetical protein J0L97_10560, partial [Alphaproteobacteria bacterium]|nr:hypothetical protein [Alphaproteobacteria bacterium]